MEEEYVSDLEHDPLSSDSESVIDESDIESGSQSAIPSEDPSLTAIPQSPSPAKTPPPKSPGLFPRLLSSTSIMSVRKDRDESITEGTTSSTSRASNAPSRGASVDRLSPKPVKPTAPGRHTIDSAPNARRIMRPPKFSRSRKGNNGYELCADSDIVGIVMLEIAKAEDLPKVKNSEPTSNFSR